MNMRYEHGTTIGTRPAQKGPTHGSIPFWIRLEDDLRSVRQELVTHPVYALIGDVASLGVFMASHVFAVWDFMSLLKTLQRRLTCVEVPWLPPADMLAARLINEIVLGEETDEVEAHHYMSHFDLYLAAMEEVKADTRPIQQFVTGLRMGLSPQQALAPLPIPESTRRFVLDTLVTCGAPTLEVAASFLLGREDLVPVMFQRLADQLERSDTRCDSFRLYLDRHVHLDSEVHAPLAKKLLANLCNEDPASWLRATTAARAALLSRRLLWDGTAAALMARPRPSVQ